MPVMGKATNLYCPFETKHVQGNIETRDFDFRIDPRYLHDKASGKKKIHGRFDKAFAL